MDREAKAISSPVLDIVSVVSAQEGIALALLADCGGRAVAGKDRGFIGQRQQLLVNVIA